ncbi:MAG: phage holin family protein [Chloroflexota bacterium]
MRDFFVNLVANMLSIALTAYLVAGIHIPDSVVSLAVIALIFGLINAVVRPILTILSLPFIVVTFGLFLLVLNGVLLAITAAITPLTIDSFWWGVLGATIISVINMILNGILYGNRNARVEVVRH